VIITSDDLLAPVHESWRACLTDHGDVLADIAGFLNSERAEGRGFLPGEHLVMRALSVPLPEVRVLILGQDPYPTPGHAVGLAFSVAPDISPVPASLRNIFTELSDDIAVPIADSGDLTPWTDQGVLLLNRVLTVTPGAAGSHWGRGWEGITLAVVRELARVSPGFVAVLWGNSAAHVSSELGDAPVLRSAHPSPLSAYRGFFGSRPFSWANRELTRLGFDPVDWSLPAERSARL
jgi:uracil-DNA glycosylase